MRNDGSDKWLRLQRVALHGGSDKWPKLSFMALASGSGAMKESQFSGSDKWLWSH